MTVSLTINGRRAFVEDGATIYQAAEKMGIFIPTLCYHPQLRPLGYCRVCLVEVEGIDRPITSCNTPVTEGMVVTTDTPAVIESRHEILSMVLATHPVEDCLTCEKGGSCQLQEGAYKTGINPGREFYPVGEDREAAIDENDYYIIRDQDKCILCGRCIRACREHANRFVFKLEENGVCSKIEVGEGENEVTLEDAGCISCGICVEVCPVGALVEKSRKFQGREWEFEEYIGVCNHCGVGCPLSFKVKDDKVVKINAATESQDSDIWICHKGKFGYDYLQSEERVTKPLIRKGERGKGEFEEASWEEAIEYASRRFKEIKEQNGGKALSVLSSGRLTNEENYLLQKLARVAMGTNNLEIGIHSGFDRASLAMDDMLGLGLSTCSQDAVRRADTILLLGSDLTKTHPVIGMNVQSAVRYMGARLVDINTEDTEISKVAQVKLRPKAGTYETLVKGIASLAIEEKAVSGNGNLEQVKNELSGYSVDKVASETGVAAEDIRQAASFVSRSKNVLSLVGQGYVCEQGYDNTAALINMHLATDQIGRQNAGIILLHDKSNNQGALDVGGVPELLPDYNRMNDEEARQNFAELWKADLPSAEGQTAGEICRAAASGDIKGMYMVGDNQNVSNDELGEKAYAGLEFLVVQELYLSPATRYADIVLPCASFLETEGTFTNLEGILQKHDCVLDPPEQARPDWKIISDLSTAMGYKMDYESPQEIDDEIIAAMRLEGATE